jgi:hypothetical protein
VILTRAISHSAPTSTKCAHRNYNDRSNDDQSDAAKAWGIVNLPEPHCDGADRRHADKQKEQQNL